MKLSIHRMLFISKLATQLFFHLVFPPTQLHLTLQGSTHHFTRMGSDGDEAHCSCRLERSLSLSQNWSDYWSIGLTLYCLFYLQIGKSTCYFWGYSWHLLLHFTCSLRILIPSGTFRYLGIKLQLDQILKLWWVMSTLAICWTLIMLNSNFNLDICSFWIVFLPYFISWIPVEITVLNIVHLGLGYSCSTFQMWNLGLFSDLGIHNLVLMDLWTEEYFLQKP